MNKGICCICYSINFNFIVCTIDTVLYRQRQSVKFIHRFFYDGQSQVQEVSGGQSQSTYIGKTGPTLLNDLDA